MKEPIKQVQALALHDLALQLEITTLPELKTMHQYALDQSADFVKRASQRATWKRIATLIKQELK